MDTSIDLIYFSQCTANPSDKICKPDVLGELIEQITGNEPFSKYLVPCQNEKYSKTIGCKIVYNKISTNNFQK